MFQTTPLIKCYLWWARLVKPLGHKVGPKDKWLALDLGILLLEVL
jgi:hypothetical protein